VAAAVLYAGRYCAPVAQDPSAQVELARAEGALQAAPAFVFGAVDDVWLTALTGDLPGVPQRARLQLAAHRAMRASLEAVTRSPAPRRFRNPTHCSAVYEICTPPDSTATSALKA